jgi:hypothetical protein
MLLTTEIHINGGNWEHNCEKKNSYFLSFQFQQTKLQDVIFGRALSTIHKALGLIFRKEKKKKKKLTFSLFCSAFVSQ